MSITLSIYPNRRGFGYAVMDGPHILVDYAATWIPHAANAEIIARLTKLLAHHEPSMIILREHDRTLAKRSKRLVKLIEIIADFLKDKDIPVYRYSREDIKNVFEQFGAPTKRQIAAKLAQEYTELRDRLPKPYTAWSDEGHSMGVFDALALIATHNYLTNRFDLS